MNGNYCLSSSIRKRFQHSKYDRFLINMIYAFQDRENLYLVCDLMSGGDLRFHIGKKKRFTEEQTSKGQLLSLLSFHRVYAILYDCGLRIYAQQWSYPQRYKARKCGYGRERIR
jgi:serine/threonine protein kinase